MVIENVKLGTGGSFKGSRELKRSDVGERRGRREVLRLEDQAGFVVAFLNVDEGSMSD